MRFPRLGGSDLHVHFYYDPPRSSGPSLQLLATVRLLVQSALVALHHVDEVGQRLLLVHGDVAEVSADRLKTKTDGRVSDGGVLCG